MRAWPGSPWQTASAIASPRYIAFQLVEIGGIKSRRRRNHLAQTGIAARNFLDNRLIPKQNNSASG
jgi:hypothetical protein